MRDREARTQAASNNGGDLTIADLRAATSLTDVLTREYLEHHAIFPVHESNGFLQVATWRSSVDPQAIHDLRLLFRSPIQLVELPEVEVRDAIQRIYGGGAETAQGVIADLDVDTVGSGAEEIALDDLVHLANEAPVVKLVNLLLLEALDVRASDVHLESYADSVQVRYRIDGLLQDAASPPVRMMPAIISRLKIMAELDVTERRVPQDGRIRLRLRDREVDVRVSTLPTLHGESVVLRLLDKQQGRIALEQMGLAADTMDLLLSAASKPHGCVLATGPTGSGKTTTLYALSDHVRSGKEKMLTVEDPVEYELLGVPQVPVNEKVGLGFATALRSLLRQDPDMLLVGEIRDAETAQIATHAALTGHFVLSTLHTNDAAGALTRMLDLGVPAYLVASTVEAILAQRLVRTICRSCIESVSTTSSTVAMTNLEGGDLDVTQRFRGRGCSNCAETGYRGRTGIFELLIMSDEMRAEVARRRGAGELRCRAIEAGMRTLRSDGLRQVRAGVTTLDEVLRVTPA